MSLPSLPGDRQGRNTSGEHPPWTHSTDDQCGAMATTKELKESNEKKIGAHPQMFQSHSLSESADDHPPGCVYARKISKRFGTGTESHGKSTAKWRSEEIRVLLDDEAEAEGP